jgi:hypothetical protein
MKVLIVREDNHGVLTVAKDFASAVKLLVNTNWLDEDYCVCQNWEQHITIEEDLGEQWLEEVKKMGVDKFNRYFDGNFNLEVVEVYE